MKKLIFLSLLFISSNAFASKYAVERSDGGVSVITYNQGSKDSLEDILKEQGFEGRPVIEITDDQLPTRSERKYWKRSGGQIVVNVTKKQADLDAKASKEAEKDAVLSKLKLSKEEWEKLRGLEK